MTARCAGSRATSVSTRPGGARNWVRPPSSRTASSTSRWRADHGRRTNPPTGVRGDLRGRNRRDHRHFSQRQQRGVGAEHRHGHGDCRARPDRGDRDVATPADRRVRRRHRGADRATRADPRVAGCERRGSPRARARCRRDGARSAVSHDIPAEWSSLDDHQLATQLARTAGQLLVEHRDQLIERGTTHWQLCDSGDMLGHHFLMDALRSTRPADAVLSEEGSDDRKRLSNDRVWIVDPLDGTNEY
ncbi:MAG: hypothetical protein EBS32_04640, partial [Actinobacteria bacterium]|nr:hypothetical protein [Actinomycetota bacterium]